jgi:hypothetical protein
MTTMSIELLLTDIDDLGAALGRLPWESLGLAPRPAQRIPSNLAVPGHSSDLVAEKWGVITPASAAGEEMLGWVRPLCELRKQQSGLTPGAALPVWRVSPGMTAQQARSWRVEYERIHPRDRPGYLLILGDLHEVSHELQQELMVTAAVGRLCFTEPDGQPSRAGYEAYCAKVCSVEGARAGWDAAARLLFYAAHDGTTATQEGYYDLVRRCYLDAGTDARLGAAGLHLFGRAEDHEWYAPEGEPALRERTLLHFAQMSGPAVLMSLTHGAATRDPAAQRLQQGAVVLREAAGRQRTEILDQAFFARPFLPGGFWFIEACFGAGTPATSAYEHWIAALHRLGRHGEDPRDALAYLAGSSRPFIARVPQVTLAHPGGPLGVLGHVDLAWTHGYQGVSEIDLSSIHADHGAYYDVLRMVMCGERFGAAVASLSGRAQQLGTHLAGLYGEAERSGSASEKEQGLRAWLWMRYLDLSGYILLGDPACQIPTRAARVVAEQVSEPSPSPAGAAHPVEQMEQAVLACLRQQRSPDEIARGAGVHPSMLERWQRVYQEAGRRALAEIAKESEGGDGS